MSSVNFNTKSMLSMVSVDQDIPLQPDQIGQFFSVTKKYNNQIYKNFKEQKNMDMIENYKRKNETKTQKQAQVKQQKTRKTRKDKQGRIFKCGGCSNDYLSYPALYTHIKSKHGGITPQGTMRGQNGKTKKRGRPKNRRNPQTLYQRQTFQSQFPKNLMNLVDKDILTALQGYDCQKKQDQQVDISNFSKWLLDQKLTNLILMKNSTKFIILPKNQQEQET